jgi:hypothetical protein
MELILVLAGCLVVVMVIGFFVLFTDPKTIEEEEEEAVEAEDAAEHEEARMQHQKELRTQQDTDPTGYSDE